MEDLKVVVAEHSQQIRSLFEQQKEIKALAASTQELAVSVRALVEQMKGHEHRISQIEESARYKARTVWACVVTGILGAGIAFFMGVLLR